jgi:hypothetical protein
MILFDPKSDNFFLDWKIKFKMYGVYYELKECYSIPFKVALLFILLFL